MAEPPVINASPVIVLSRAGWTELLHVEGDHVLVPRAVVGEVQHRGADDPAVRALAELPRLVAVETGQVAPAVDACGIDPVKAAALTWALAYMGTTAIVDDRKARRCAAELGITIRGTLGLILVAKLRGSIPVVRPLVDAVRRAGFYLSDEAINQALATVGE